MNKVAGFPIGMRLVHNNRTIRLARYMADWALGFVDDETGLDYFVFSEECGVAVRTTVDWLFAEKEAGRLIDPDESSGSDGLRRTFLGLDKAACIRRDPKSAWRFRWAWAVLKNGPETKSDNSYRKWISEQPDLVNDDEGNPEEIPSPSSLRRWERALTKVPRRGALVSCAGRIKGRSSLPSLEDYLVHEAALYHWSTEDTAVLDAGGYYIDARDRIVGGNDEELKKRLASKPARLETVRRRIRSLETSAAVEARDGKRRARRMFEPAGDGVEVERFLERVEMDGVELRQIVTFSDDWQVASGKMKLINAIDALTHFWWVPAMFCGPYREEMTAIALRAVMMPPGELAAELLEQHPWLAEAFGTPDLIAPDNEKAIFSPGAISALTELGIEIELPAANHPDSKPLVEALNRFLKAFFAALPGTVRGPRKPHDPTRNAVDEAEMTRAQFRTQLLAAWLYWNTTGRPFFDGRSPLDMVKACIESGDKPKRNTPGQVKRGLSKTHDNVVVTRDGFELDGINYTSPDLKAVFDANYRHTGFKDRLDGTSKILASIRTFEGNLHEAEIYDADRHVFVEVFSTEPGYTLYLSRWEHGEYKLAMSHIAPRKASELDKMRMRGARLRTIASDLPKAGVKAATKMAGLLESDEMRRAAGARAHDADFRDLQLHGLLATTGAEIRTDEPRPVHVPAAAKRKPRPEPPADVLEALGGVPATLAPDQHPGEQEPEDFSWPDLPDDGDDNGDDA